MTFTLEKAGSALALRCTPRRGHPPVMLVENWKCPCGCNTIAGRNMRADGERSRVADAVCSSCGHPAGRLVADGLPKDALPVGASW